MEPSLKIRKHTICPLVEILSLIRTLAASLLLHTASDTSEHDPVSLKGSQWFLPCSQIPSDLEYPEANLKSQAHLQMSWETVREAFAVSFHLGFPKAQWVKNLPAMQGPRFNLWARKIPWRMKWQPTPVFLPGESHGQRSLVGYSPWGRKSQTRLND